MKRLLTILLVLASFAVKAQSIDYNKIIVTEQISAISFEERFGSIRLAQPSVKQSGDPGS
jgi:hypothetical protein